MIRVKQAASTTNKLKRFLKSQALNHKIRLLKTLALSFQFQCFYLVEVNTFQV